MEEMQQLCSSVYVVKQSKWRSILSAVQSFARGIPASVGYFSHDQWQSKVSRIIATERPDWIYVQLVRMVPYILKLDKDQRMAIDYMDAFSLRALRRADQSRGVEAWFWKNEARLLQQFETAHQHRFRHRFIISETDMHHLANVGVEHLQLLKNGVDTQYFEPQRDSNVSYDLVFVGNMSYHPNIQAAKYLVQEIARSVRSVLPELRVLIAGADPTREVLALKNDWVEVTGYMEDIRNAYASGKVFVAPIFSGSGLQNKILEAMAMEIPCITTSIVADSIGAPYWFVQRANDKEAFCDQIGALLSDEISRAKLGRQARVFVSEQFGWNQCCTPLDALSSQESTTVRKGMEHK